MMTKISKSNANKRILLLLTVPSASKGDQQYHLELRSPTQILSAKCRQHSELISQCLDVDLQSCELDSISILGFKNEDHIQIFAAKGNDPFFHHSGELKLLPPSHSPRAMYGPFVNTKWIDHSLPRRWKQRCDIEHACTSLESLSRIKGKLPLWVIDTWQQCLVPCSHSTPYVALSYVWGGTPTFMALKDNIKQLQNPSSLAERSTKMIPKTIRDAMFFVQRLGERYLWADMLCIVQDDEQKLAEIANMGAIYAQASITIVASDGDNADDGLRGPIVDSKFCSPGHVWAKISETVRWIQWTCHGAVWLEFAETGGRAPRVFSKLVPDVLELAMIVNTFCNKNFTFPEDALFAFSGIASALSSTFYGGFVSGLPVLFFYIGLLWMPISTASRRKPKRSGADHCIPSWSWAGWKGVGPKTLKGTKSIIRDTLHEYMEIYWNKLHTPCPPGWARRSIKDPSGVPDWQIANQPQPYALPLCFYMHESEPDSEFWYPLPIPQTEEPVKPHILARYITCKTRRCWLVSGERVFHKFQRQAHMVSIRDREGNWVGILKLCEPLVYGIEGSGSGAGDGINLELVEIARGSVRNDGPKHVDYPIEEWVLDERPKGGNLYEYYYVLWIEWMDGIAYRKGLGRVHKDSWESQEREWIDLVLG
ncbi:hypothetical protein CIB48_g8719 [Xylaria polymorpha]|nr:hypothetical protein CIB48_g8719 [Xylaria polymorpha]